MCNIDNTVIYEEFDYTNKHGDIYEIVVQKEDAELVTIDIIYYDDKRKVNTRYNHVPARHNSDNSSLGNAKLTFYKFIEAL